MPDLFSGILNNILASGARGDIRSLTRFRPQGFMGPGGFGITPGGQGQMGPEQMQMMQMMMGGGQHMLGGGLFNDANFQNAFGNNDMGGAFGDQQNLLQQMFSGSPFEVGDQAQGMFDRGFANLDRAGDTEGLQQQFLDAQRAQAQPFENRLVNTFKNDEFLGNMGATSGSVGRRSDLADNLFRADQGRVLGAQQLGQQQQGLLQNLGLAQTGQGFQGMNQGFMQALQGHQQNINQGQSRLQNSMNLFGLGNETFGGNFERGLGAQSGITDINRLFSEFFLGQQNAAANRIGATGQHANAFASVFGDIANSNSRNFMGI